MASESGVLSIPEERIVRKWRLQPGKMLLIALEQGRIVEDEEIQADLAGAAPYGEWLRDPQYKLEELPAADAPAQRSEGTPELRKADRQRGVEGKRGSGGGHPGG